jgi:hypothetical protein
VFGREIISTILIKVGDYGIKGLYERGRREKEERGSTKEFI